MVVELEGVHTTRLWSWRESILHVCGAGGSRTLVQTGKPYAFYMLILVFIFVMQQDPSHQLQPYPLKLHPPVEAPKRLFPIYLHRYTFLIRNNIQKSDVSFSHLVRE